MHHPQKYKAYTPYTLSPHNTTPQSLSHSFSPYSCSSHTANSAQLPPHWKPEKPRSAQRFSFTAYRPLPAVPDENVDWFDRSLQADIISHGVPPGEFTTTSPPQHQYSSSWGPSYTERARRSFHSGIGVQLGVDEYMMSDAIVTDQRQQPSGSVSSRDGLNASTSYGVVGSKQGSYGMVDLQHVYKTEAGVSEDFLPLPDRDTTARISPPAEVLIETIDTKDERFHGQPSHKNPAHTPGSLRLKKLRDSTMVQSLKSTFHKPRSGSTSSGASTPLKTTRKQSFLFSKALDGGASAAEASAAVGEVDIRYIYTAQSSEYWTGRFVALSDRFHAEVLEQEPRRSARAPTAFDEMRILVPVDESQDPADKTTMKQRTLLRSKRKEVGSDVHGRRYALLDQDEKSKRVFRHLESLCRTAEARRSLHGWQEEYARKVKKPGLLPPGGQMSDAKRVMRRWLSGGWKA